MLSWEDEREQRPARLSTATVAQARSSCVSRGPLRPRATGCYPSTLRPTRALALPRATWPLSWSTLPSDNDPFCRPDAPLLCPEDFAARLTPLRLPVPTNTPEQAQRRRAATLSIDISVVERRNGEKDGKYGCFVASKFQELWELK